MVAGRALTNASACCTASTALARAARPLRTATAARAAILVDLLVFALVFAISVASSLAKDSSPLRDEAVNRLVPGPHDVPGKDAAVSISLDDADFQLRFHGLSV